MKTIRYKGGAGPERTYKRGLKQVTFAAGETVQVEDDFADELLAQNPDGLTVEEAEPYSIPVFEEVGADRPARNVEADVREASR